MRALEDLLTEALIAVEAVGEYHRTNDLQPADCWSRNGDTTVELEDKVLTVRLGVTEAGTTIRGLLSSVREEAS